AVILPEETAKTALMISLDQPVKIKITDPKGNTSETKENISVSFNPMVGLYRLEIIPKESTETYLHISQIPKGQEAQTRSFSLMLKENRPFRFYLIYNPNNPIPVNLISL
ncbi:hypothetical protein HY029_04515, partial [Candidatus Gottesmanbacteria bacterium]|nr:hypothetical protein [Candidatus Gottesmanbacteria bacterium]